MYLNFKLLYSKGLTHKDFVLLVALNQQRSERLSDYIVDICEQSEEPLLQLEDKGLVTFVKGKAKDTIFDKARLSDKGKEIFDQIQIAELNEDDNRVWDWLVIKYKEQSKEIGNVKKGKQYLAQFRVESGINRNKLATLCSDFINNPESMDYSHRLDYLFYRAPNVFATKFSLDDSKLYQFYLKNKEYYDKKFSELE